MTEEYSFEISADLKAARKAVEDFSSRTQKQLDGLNMKEAISAIHDGFELIAKVVEPVFELISEGFKKSIEEGLNAEASQFRLSNALRLTGDSAGGAFEHFEKLAKAYHNTSVFTEEAVESAIGLAKQFQLNNAEAEKAIKVAVDLAAATDGDLGGAMRRVAQTFEGFVDRSLGKMIPALKSMSLESLIAGGALEKIGARVRGTSDALANTFGGVLTSVKNNINEIFKTIGEAFIDNEALKAGLKVIKDGLSELNTVLEKNSAHVQELVTNGFVALVAAMPAVVSGFSLAVEIFDRFSLGIQRISIVLGAFTASALSGNFVHGSTIFQAMHEDLDKLDDSFFKNKAARDVIFDKLRESAEKMAKGVADAAAKTQGLGKELKNIGSSLTGPQGREKDLFGPEKIAEFTKKIADLKAQLAQDVQTKLSEIANAPISGLIKLTIKGSEELDKAKEKISSAVASIVNDTKISQAFKDQAKALGEKAVEGLNKAFSLANVGASIAANLIDDIKLGAEGAKKAVADTVGGIVSVFFGEAIGKLVSSLISALSQGGAIIKEQLHSFQKAIPEVIEGILTAIPDVIQQLVDGFPEFVKKLIDAIPRIIDAFVKHAPRFIQTFIELMPQLIGAIIKGIPQIIIAIVRSIPEIIKGFVQGLIAAASDFVQALFDAVTGIFGGGSGNSSSSNQAAAAPGLGFITDIFGFAQGGTIPDSPGLRGDKALARLDAGETVIDRTLVNRLSNFLDGAPGGAGGAQTIILQVGLKELARVTLDVNRGGFRTA